MRARGGKQFSVGDMLKEVNKDRTDQIAAQIAVLSCEVSLNAIKKGLFNHMYNLRKKPKTKYEYNMERVRDFRYGKAETNSDAKVEQVAEELERTGKASYAILQTDPPPFIRNYNYNIYQENALAKIHKKFDSFKHIERIDFSHQLIGDERLIQLCDAMKRCPVKILILCGNQLSDKGLESLSYILRSLYQLVELNLSRNDFSDEGVQHIVDLDRYSPSLETLDLSYNVLGAKSAYYLGEYFAQPLHIMNLHSLLIGGRFGRKGWGDEFIKVLVSVIVSTNAIKSLRKLSMPDVGVSTEGIDCISAYLSCDDVALQILNISKNSVLKDDHATKSAFFSALRVNKTLKEMFITDCGLNGDEMDAIKCILKQNKESVMSSVCYKEKLVLANKAVFFLNQANHITHKLKMVITNQWRLSGPPIYQLQTDSSNKIDSSDFNLITNYQSIYNTTFADKLPAHITQNIHKINVQLKITNSLHEAYLLIKTMYIDINTMKLSNFHKMKAKNLISIITAIVLELEEYEDKLASRAVLCEANKNVLYETIYNYCVAVELAKQNAGVKYRKRGTTQTSTDLTGAAVGDCVTNTGTIDGGGDNFNNNAMEISLLQLATGSYSRPSSAQHSDHNQPQHASGAHHGINIGSRPGSPIGSPVSSPLLGGINRHALQPPHSLLISTVMHGSPKSSRRTPPAAPKPTSPASRVQNDLSNINIEKVLMCVEDYNSSVVEKTDVYKKIIGNYYKIRLLHYCLLQEFLHNNNVNNANNTSNNGRNRRPPSNNNPALSALSGKSVSNKALNTNTVAVAAAGSEHNNIGEITRDVVLKKELITVHRIINSNRPDSHKHKYLDTAEVSGKSFSNNRNAHISRLGELFSSTKKETYSSGINNNGNSDKQLAQSSSESVLLPPVDASSKSDTTTVSTQQQARSNRHTRYRLNASVKMNKTAQNTINHSATDNNESTTTDNNSASSKSQTVNQNQQQKQQSQQQSPQQSQPLSSYDYQTHLKKSMPYYNNLEVCACFLHYFYMVFPKEKLENKRKEDQLMMKVQQDESQEGAGKDGAIRSKVKQRLQKRSNLMMHSDNNAAINSDKINFVKLNQSIGLKTGSLSPSSRQRQPPLPENRVKGEDNSDDSSSKSDGFGEDSEDEEDLTSLPFQMPIVY